MKNTFLKLVTAGSLIFYFGCDILSPSTDSLTGDWDCTLVGLTGYSSAEMQLKEKSGKLTGTFQWNDLDLPIYGTVNSKRQINMETQDSTHRCIFTLISLQDDTFLDGSFAYYRNYLWLDGGSFDASKK